MCTFWDDNCGCFPLVEKYYLVVRQNKENGYYWDTDLDEFIYNSETSRSYFDFIFHFNSLSMMTLSS
jgi:hypothetical protein